MQLDIRLSLLNLLKWTDDQGHKQIFRLVNEVSSEWKKIAILLQFSMNQIAVLEEQYRANANNCWNSIMDQWLNGHTCNYPPSWDGLHILLNDIECASVSTRLKRALTGYCAL